MLRGGNPDVEWIETDANADGASASFGPFAIGSSMPDVESPTQPRPAMPPAHSMRSPRCVSCARIVAARTGSLAGPLASSAGSPSRSRATPPTASWYIGRPLLVTANDHALRLYNGDTGVIVRSPDHGVVAVFQRAASTVAISPRRISAVDTVHAMTIHKSQGSQFAAVAVVLPDPTSQILTRELLYTAVTRAQQHLIVLGTEESIRAAVTRPVARATGLRDRLWRSEASGYST